MLSSCAYSRDIAADPALSLSSSLSGSVSVFRTTARVFPDRIPCRKVGPLCARSRVPAPDSHKLPARHPPSAPGTVHNRTDDNLPSAAGLLRQRQGLFPMSALGHRQCAVRLRHRLRRLPLPVTDTKAPPTRSVPSVPDKPPVSYFFGGLTAQEQQAPTDKHRIKQNSGPPLLHCRTSFRFCMAYSCPSIRTAVHSTPMRKSRRSARSAAAPRPAGKMSRCSMHAAIPAPGMSDRTPVPCQALPSFVQGL